MESDDLKSTPDDARLAALLRQHSSELIRDDGFSANVLAALPEKRKTSLGPRTRDLVVAVFACVVVFSLQAARAGSTASISSLTEVMNQFTALFTETNALIAIAITAGTLFFLEDVELPEV